VIILEVCIFPVAVAKVHNQALRSIECYLPLVGTLEQVMKIRLNGFSVFDVIPLPYSLVSSANFNTEFTRVAGLWQDHLCKLGIV